MTASTALGNYTEQERVRDDLRTYILELLENGHGRLGYNSAVFLGRLIEEVDEINLVLMSDDEFAYNTKKTRRSAFYTEIDAQRTILLNRDNPPTPPLLLHELIKDRHYEVSGSLQILNLLRQQGSDSNYPDELGEAVEQSINRLVDRYGLGANSPHQWIDEDIQSTDQNNSSFNNDVINQSVGADLLAPGGDISGGGGDGGGFEAKSRILLEVLRKLADLYQKELGLSGRALIRKLDDLYFLLSIKVYVETDYNSEQQGIQYYFGTDAIERLLFFPYLIKVPPRALTSDEIAAAADVVLQSDLFREIPSLRLKYNSTCYCVNDNQKVKLPYLCPDPQQLHPSIHHLTDFYQAETEKSMACRIAFERDL